MRRELTTYRINGQEYPGAREHVLGRNFDMTYTTLPAFVDIQGVQVHPSRVERYLANRVEIEKKSGLVSPQRNLGGMVENGRPYQRPTILERKTR